MQSLTQGVAALRLISTASAWIANDTESLNGLRIYRPYISLLILPTVLQIRHSISLYLGTDI